MGINLILAIAGSITVGLLVGIAVMLVNRNFREKDPETRYQGQLDAILNSAEEYDGEHDSYTDYKRNSGIIAHWNGAWGRGFAEISSQFSPDDSKGGIIAGVIWAAITALVTVLFQNVIAGAVIATVILVVLFLVLRSRIARRDDVIRHQLTGFLFALKANITANETPERAFLKVVPNMPSPLQDELITAKTQIASNMGFGEAIENLREDTNSEDLRFLCSCMIQATATGVSLEEQIDIILEAVEQKRRTTEEITQSTKSANMSMYAAGIIIPAGFIGIYLLDERAREYWFVDPMSWIALAVAAGISFVGIRQARKFVAKVREL